MDKKSLKDTKTRENLMKAFAGESMARNRYSMFASIAEKEGFYSVAKVFRNTSDNEKEHAEAYFKFLDGDDVKINDIAYPSCYGSTLENLLCAAKYEEEEHSTMYPEFGRIAQKEGFDEISTVFFNIASIEEHHSERYKKLAEMIENGEIYKSKEKVEWECLHCGYHANGTHPPKKCPVCEKPYGYYVRDYKCFN